MNLIDLTRVCPKCGSLDWHRNFMPPREGYISQYDFDRNPEEHIYSRCKVCNYAEDSLPLSSVTPDGRALAQPTATGEGRVFMENERNPFIEGPAPLKPTLPLPAVGCPECEAEHATGCLRIPECHHRHIRTNTLTPADLLAQPAATGEGT